LTPAATVRRFLHETERGHGQSIDEEVPNLLGQVPLEVLDFVVDARSQKLIANPDHGGLQMTEEYRSA
jgi:hypothetical protein